jgi:hypothetical protein
MEAEKAEKAEKAERSERAEKVKRRPGPSVLPGGGDGTTWV